MQFISFLDWQYHYWLQCNVHYIHVEFKEQIIIIINLLFGKKGKIQKTLIRKNRDQNFIALEYIRYT